MSDCKETNFPVKRRTEDKAIYLSESRYDRPKEVFKRLGVQVRESGVLREGGRVCDFGCAAGEFLYFFHQQFPSAKCLGFDVVGELLEKAREKVPGADFRPGSVLDRSLLAGESIDVAFMLGVLSIFDDFEPPLANLLHWTKSGGRIYVVSWFNPYPLDVWVTYRRAEEPVRDHREAGWNMISKASVSRYLDAALGRGRYTFTPFEMPFDLHPNTEDPARTWTFRDESGRRLFTNGLSLLCNMEILEIRP